MREDMKEDMNEDKKFQEMYEKLMDYESSLHEINHKNRLKMYIYNTSHISCAAFYNRQFKDNFPCTLDRKSFWHCYISYRCGVCGL